MSPGAVAVALILGSVAAADGGANDARAPVNLIAFVGRRISARVVPPKQGTIPFDAEYEVTFEVLQVVYGSYAAKRITFTSYVHVGPPAFLTHALGLVYVSRFEGRFVQQKYLFQPVYPTKDGRWAGCGDPYAHVAEVHRHGVKPEPILFDPPVRIQTGKLPDSQIERDYPSPLFLREDGVVVCRMGNYPEQLFQVMAEGYLKARGVFGPAPDSP
jgi:hypothetical protein